MQSKRDSLVEVTLNTLVGMAIALLTQLLWFPMIGKTFTPFEHLATTAVFTAVSVLRGYVIRRMFNNFTVKQVEQSRERS